MWTRATSRPLNRREGVQPSSGGSPRVTSAAETEGSPNLRAAAARQLMPPPGAVSPKRKAAGSDVDRPRSAGSDASDGSVGSAGPCASGAKPLPKSISMSPARSSSRNISSSVMNGGSPSRPSSLTGPLSGLHVCCVV